MGKKKKSTILAFLILTPGLWVLFAYVLAVNLEVEKTLTSSDAILVMSGSADFTERSTEAAALYKAGVSQKILLTDDGRQSGWNRDEQKNPFFVELARRQLVRQGVREEAVEILAPKVDGTIDEAHLLARTASENNLKSVLLVTSAYHSRRTLWTFERVFAKNNLPVEIGVKSPAEEIQARLPFTWWLSCRGWGRIAPEYFKIAYYWWRY